MLQTPVTPALRRLKPGRRTDLALRGAGAALLLPGLAAIHDNRLNALRPHACGPLEFACALAVIVLLWVALGLLFAGDDLLRPMPRPPRPLQ